MSWNSEDNKHYRGKIDRMYVSDTEYWETEYYIDHYLKNHGYGVTHSNRHAIAKHMENFPGRAPHKRVDMDAYLDKVLKK